MIIFVVKILKGFGWKNLADDGPALHPLSGVSGAGILKVTSIMQQSEKTVQSPNAVLMTGQRRRLWVNIETVRVCAQYTTDPVID